VNGEWLNDEIDHLQIEPSFYSLHNTTIFLLKNQIDFSGMCNGFPTMSKLQNRNVSSLNNFSNLFGGHLAEYGTTFMIYTAAMGFPYFCMSIS